VHDSLDVTLARNFRSLQSCLLRHVGLAVVGANLFGSDSLSVNRALLSAQQANGFSKAGIAFVTELRRSQLPFCSRSAVANHSGSRETVALRDVVEVVLRFLNSADLLGGDRFLRLLGLLRGNLLLVDNHFVFSIRKQNTLCFESSGRS